MQVSNLTPTFKEGLNSTQKGNSSKEFSTFLIENSNKATQSYDELMKSVSNELINSGEDGEDVLITILLAQAELVLKAWYGDMFHTKNDMHLQKILQSNNKSEIKELLEVLINTLEEPKNFNARYKEGVLLSRFEELELKNKAVNILKNVIKEL